MTSSAADDLRRVIAREEARLASLDADRRQAEGRLEALRARLAASEATAAYRTLPLLPDSTRPESSAEKVTLFRQLFRGRDDPYPKLWTNTTTGRKGYAPACANEWVRGICEKPRVKCGECRGTGIPAALDRSRSGQGAHAWFFFAAPVVASAARKMVCFLLTETMAHRHQLGMASYDRLFPNQDTLPRGGFGNLIALPLQHGPRQEGHTVFVDDHLVPHPDQWALLTSVPRIDPTTVDRIARDATRTGQVVGVRWSETTDDDDAAPWDRSPSRQPPTGRFTGPLPKVVRAVLAQRLFVEKAGLASPHLNQIKRLAAFQNPEFYKKQRLRLSTALTPRVIACAEDLPDHVALPRGCREELEALLRGAGIPLTVEDRRQTGEAHALRFEGTLTPVQEQAAQALLGHDIGVFVAPPGVGKTVVGTYLVAARARTTLILVHRQPLLDQWMAQLSMFLGIDPKTIGQIGAGKRNPTGRLDVAMIQSLVREGSVDDLVAGYGQVIVDECHHVPAVSFERVLSEVKARFVAGLTATPRRHDGWHPILEMQLGPVRFTVDPRTQAADRPFEHRLFVRETTVTAGSLDPSLGIQTLYAALAADESRNGLIVDDVVQALGEGRSPILLTERKDHLEVLATRLRPFVRHLVVLQGGMTPAERRDVTAQLARIPDTDPRLVLATGRYIGEGFDDARLDTLFLTMPVSWKGTLVQYAGRLHRLHPSKTEVRIYDYVDREVPLFLRMFEKRRRGYRAIGYTRNDGPLNDEAPVNDGTTEIPVNPTARKTSGPRRGRRPKRTSPPTTTPW
jgi:superfamily II DNA or RNA helicase